MATAADLNEKLAVTGQVLIRCFFFGYALLLVWAGGLLLADDFIYRVHSSFSNIAREQFDAIHYAGLLVTKLAIFVLFFCPWLAVRLVLKKRLHK